MARLMSVLVGLMHPGSILIFPGVAAWAIRRGGPTRLNLVTGLAVGLVALVALIGASARFGNVRAAKSGYGETAPLVLLFFGLTMAMPILSAAFAIRFVQPRMNSVWAVYAAGVGAAVVAVAVGVIAATLLAW
jgi:hypothetical protein